jgi:hypothetical protein
MDAKDIHLQKLTAMLTQLVEQLKVTQATKTNFDIDDVFKTVNQIFKTTQADKTVLRDFQKTIKSLTNSQQFEKLSKAFYTLDKTFKDPDIKQLKGMNITANNIFSELSILEDTLKNINISKNEKANLTLLSKSIAEGHRLYSVQGFGRNADQFYKNATIQQLLLLKNMEKNLKDGVPLKGLAGNGILGTMAKVGASGPITAIADVLLKSAGMGELPGQIAELFMNKNGKEGESKKEQANAARVAGIQGAKDAAKGSIIFNKEKMKNIETALSETESYKETLTNDLASALARTLKTDEKGVDSRFAKDEAPYEVDMKKLTDAIRAGSLSKDEIESLIKTKYIVQTESGESDTTISDALIAKVESLDDYKRAIDEYKESKINTAKEVQSALETFSELTSSMRAIMNKEIVAEFREIDKIANKMFGSAASKEKEGFAQTFKNRKLESVREAYGIGKDEEIGISKYGSRNIGTDYADLAELTKSEKQSKAITDLLEDFETQQILQQNKLMTNFETTTKKIEDKTEDVKDLLAKYEKAEKTKTGASVFAQVRERTSIEDIPESLRKEVVEKSAQKAVDDARRESEYTGAGIDIDKVEENANRIYTEMMENLLTSFKDQDTMNNQKQVDSLKKILEGGTVNVRVSNLNDILSGSPGSNVSSPMAAPKSAFGE